jgi:demethylmenaquinone methyltransferase/2-methoxy-6-polyprenyl-1,4-benzoquinol methylase
LLPNTNLKPVDCPHSNAACCFLNMKNHHNNLQFPDFENNKLFGDIARKYDLLNHLLSLNLDRSWRKKLVDSACAQPGEKILDVCVGTGDIAIRFARNGGPEEIVGIDLSEPMLRVAERKTRNGQLHRRIKLLQGDALSLPFADRAFDIATIGFGLRNIRYREQGIREMARILKKGGRLVILEFSPPENRIFGRIYGLYLHTVIRAVGGIVSGSADAYRYLSTSIEGFPSPREIMGIMESEGLSRVTCQRLTGGICYIYRGTKGTERRSE